MRIKITLIFTFLIQIGLAQIEISAGPAYESFNFNGKSLNLIGARVQFGNPIFEDNLTITLPLDYLRADTLSFFAIDPSFRYYLNDRSTGFFIGGSIGVLFNLESKFEEYITPLKFTLGYRQFINDNFFVDFSSFIGYQSSSLKSYSVIFGANANFGIMF